MCGIALLLSGIHVRRPDNLLPNGDSPTPPSAEMKKKDKKLLTIADLTAVLLRRGPDCLGHKKFFIECRECGDGDYKLVQSSFEPLHNFGLDSSQLAHLCTPPRLHVFSPVSSADDRKGVLIPENKNESSAHVLDSACPLDTAQAMLNNTIELQLLGATLHLRGASPVLQPLKDAFENHLLYNGEIFGGIHVDMDKNDGEVLLRELESCSSCDCHLNIRECACTLRGESSVPNVLSTIRGPFALVYWQSRSKNLWFGRDAFGRRSLLVHWPSIDDPRFVLSSVSPPPSVKRNSSCALSDESDPAIGPDDLNVAEVPDYWEELPCGIYSISLGNIIANDKCTVPFLSCDVRKHEWTDPFLRNLAKWERTHVDSTCEVATHQHFVSNGISARSSLKTHKILFNGHNPDHCVGSGTEAPTVNLNFSAHDAPIYCAIEKMLNAGNYQPAHRVLNSLRESVLRRTVLSSTFEGAEKIHTVPVAVLFSGGLDSMILAALLDECLNSQFEIDLLNVSFDGLHAPDRISAREGLLELQGISPYRRWRLVEIDADLSNLTSEIPHVMSLICPAKTYMDLNIGIALWLAARGEGFVDGEPCSYQREGSPNHRYKSKSRILLVGSGADEQCAGYGRHRTKYRLGGWSALEEEMKLDMQRIWKRNLGRDDRCISDHGKEARFPFLDEDVINTLLEIPLWQVTNLEEPVGKGDKKILREVARLLGLEGAASLPKRAIQFGSRIARESNKKNFGSNRAANQASAGSVIIGPGK